MTVSFLWCHKRWLTWRWGRSQGILMCGHLGISKWWEGSVMRREWIARWSWGIRRGVHQWSLNRLVEIVLKKWDICCMCEYYPNLFYHIPSHTIPSYSTLSHPIKFYSIMSHPITFYHTLPYLILCYSIITYM